MQKEIKRSRSHLNFNILFSIFACILNIVFFKLLGNIEHSILYNFILNGFLLFLYYNKLFSQMRKMLVGIKKEVSYTNLPKRVLIFFIGLLFVLAYNIFTLYRINPEAINTIFVSNLFTSTITTNLPLIILLIFIYLITPTLIIPNYNNTAHKKANDILLVYLSIIVLILIFAILINKKVENENYNIKEYELKKISFGYNTKFLKFVDMSEEAKTKIKKNSAVFPFSYTVEEETKFSYEEAQDFCNSINANVSSLSEIYNILFNEFKIEGNEYYWTSDKAGRANVVLHFNNLNYEAKKAPNSIKAQVICTTKSDKNKLYLEKSMLKDEAIEQAERRELNQTQFDIPTTEIKNEQIKIPTEFIGFDIKFVPEAYLNKMIANGYMYDKAIKINPFNEIRRVEDSNKIKTTDNQIKLCHFPFLSYEAISIEEEKEIWKQNFCSPAFELIEIEPTIKTKYEKDAFCAAHGGRIPNISEFAGILKSTNKINKSLNYWVKNTFTRNGQTEHILLQQISSIPIKVKVATETDSANVICIKIGNKQSNIIANFSSKFPNESGLYYAKQKCQRCDYYEMPDMVLNQ